MDIPQDVREVLESILAKNPEQLTEHEKAFLNARRDYLNNEQKRIFASVLKTTEQLHEEVVAKQEATQYLNESGQPVIEQAPEQPQEPNIVTEQVQTPASDVQSEPVAPTDTTEVQTPEVLSQPEQPSQPEVPVEPVAPVETPSEQPQEPVAPVEQPAADVNPYDVNVSEKDPDA